MATGNCSGEIDKRIREEFDRVLLNLKAKVEEMCDDAWQEGYDEGHDQGWYSAKYTKREEQINAERNIGPGSAQGPTRNQRRSIRLRCS